MERLVNSIARFCGDHPTGEKWLIAPNIRAGYQWVDRAAGLLPGGVVNIRVKTLRAMALDLAWPRLAGEGLRPLTWQGGFFLTARVFSRLRGQSNGGGYLLSLESTPALIRRIRSTLDELRLAGAVPADLRPSSFEDPLKAREMRILLEAYLAELEARRLADYAGMLRIAADEAAHGTRLGDADIHVLLPAGERLAGLERALFESIPRGRAHLLAEDFTDPAEPESDAGLLAFLNRPQDAPSPQGDLGAEIFRAVGEANEVRGLLRRCLAEGVPLDRVEVLHTDAGTYVPLVYELLHAWLPEASSGPESFPATFADGLPVRYTRPGRALAAWLEWMEDGFPRQELGRMLADGLLERPPEIDAESFGALAELLSRAGIGAGRERYVRRLDSHIAGLERKLAHGEELDNPEDDERNRYQKIRRLERELERARGLRSMIEPLIGISPAPGSGEDTADNLLANAREFVGRHARTAGRFDEFGRRALLDRIEEALEWAGPEGAGPGFDPRVFLAGLAEEVRIMGSGPRPGRLHVAGIAVGGHSGRPRTFILGLDDSRQPGAMLQDPVLLDGERARLSGELDTAGARLERSTMELARLLAGLRGRVSLSFCSHDPVQDREVFPGPALLAAYRVLSGSHGADQAAMLAELPPPCSFTPNNSELSLGEGEWWLWRLCAVSPGDEPAGELVRRRYPHLAAGGRAAAQRSGTALTAWDGFLGPGYPELDPFTPEGPVMSAHRLETLGACPLRYYLRYVLGAEPPEEPEEDPAMWLGPADAGSLVHDFLRDLVARLVELGERPSDSPEQRGLALRLLESHVERWLELSPPATGLAEHNRRAWLLAILDSFLAGEADYCRTHTPRWMEAGIGMGDRESAEGFACPEPVELQVAQEMSVRLRGRIDRVDRVEGTTAYSITDYKTGSAWRYTYRDPFSGGRVVQHWVYLELARKRLREAVGPDAGVEEFSYLFPSPRERGLRMSWSPDDLPEGRAVVASLCRIAASGAFLPTDDPGDCTFCDYRAVCGGTDARLADQAAASRGKLENPANEALEPMRKLRQQ